MSASLVIQDPSAVGDASGVRSDRRARRWAWLAQRLHWGILAGSVSYLALYAIIATARMGYPFELEWMEGGSLEQVRRILAGEPIYAAPRLDYTAYIYSPLYFYVSALVALVLGESFLALRLVSFLASLGCLVLIGWSVQRETGSRAAGVIAAGLFAATFRAAGAWLDLARVDSLFLFLLLGSMYLVRFGRSPMSAVGAGALLALAFHTKQTAVFLALPLAVYYAVVDRRRLLMFAVVAGMLGGAGVLLASAAAGGWYAFYLVDLPRQHAAVWPMLVVFWVGDLLLVVGIAGLAGTLGLADQARRSRQALLFWTLVSGGMVGLALVARVNAGGYNNALLPAYALVAVLFGLGMHEARASHAAAARADGWGRLTRAAMLPLGLLQLVLLVYNPWAQVPRAEDTRAGQRVVNTLAEIPGEVFIPDHGYLGVRAGKNYSTHTMAWAELLGGFGGAPTAEGERLLGELRQALRERRFGAVVVNNDGPLPWIAADLAAHYVRSDQPLVHDLAVLWPPTGHRSRPEQVYVPRPQ